MATTLSSVEPSRKVGPQGSLQSRPTFHATNVHSNPGLAYPLSVALAVVSLIACVVSVLIPSLFRDPAVTEGNIRGTALVIALVAVPAISIGMVLTARGSVRAPIVWLGALYYVFYNSVVLSFDITFNRLFVLYVAMLSLALWSIVALVTHLDLDRFDAKTTRHVHARPSAVFLLALTALPLMNYAQDTIPALLNNAMPASLRGLTMLTSPFAVVDLAFTYPLIVVAAIQLWQHRPWGYVLGGALLVWWTIELFGIPVDQLFGRASDPAQSLDGARFMAVLGLVTLVPTVAFFRGIRSHARRRGA